MEKLNTIIDREPVSSEYIESKQNFGQVIDRFNKLKPPVWKTPWFYGPIGMAIVAITVSIVTFDSHHVLAEETTIVSQNTHNVTVETEINDQPESSSNDQVVSILEEDNQQANNDEQDVEVEEPYVPEPVNHGRNVVTNEFDNDESTTESLPQNIPVEEPAVERKKNFFPHIKDYYTGEIPFSILNTGVIECNDEVEIYSFKINYNTAEGTTSRSVRGNKIPKEVLNNIRRYNIGYMIFITDIKGVTTKGKKLNLTSMNLVATE